jgi:hypothetical protein
MTAQTFPRLYNRIQSSHRTISLNIYTVRIKMLLIPGGFDHDRKLYVPLSKIVFLTFFFFRLRFSVVRRCHGNLIIARKKSALLTRIPSAGDGHLPYL